MALPEGFRKGLGKVREGIWNVWKEFGEGYLPISEVSQEFGSSGRGRCLYDQELQTRMYVV